MVKKLAEIAKELAKLVEASRDRGVQSQLRSQVKAFCCECVNSQQISLFDENYPVGTVFDNIERIVSWYKESNNGKLTADTVFVCSALVVLLDQINYPSEDEITSIAAALLNFPSNPFLATQDADFHSLYKEMSSFYSQRQVNAGSSRLGSALAEKIKKTRFSLLQTVFQTVDQGARTTLTQDSIKYLIHQKLLEDSQLYQANRHFALILWDSVDGEGLTCSEVAYFAKYPDQASVDYKTLEEKRKIAAGNTAVSEADTSSLTIRQAEKFYYLKTTEHLIVIALLSDLKTRVEDLVKPLEQQYVVRHIFQPTLLADALRDSEASIWLLLGNLLTLSKQKNQPAYEFLKKLTVAIIQYSKKLTQQLNNKEEFEAEFQKELEDIDQEAIDLLSFDNDTMAESVPDNENILGLRNKSPEKPIQNEWFDDGIIQAHIFKKYSYYCIDNLYLSPSVNASQEHATLAVMFTEVSGNLVAKIIHMEELLQCVSHEKLGNFLITTLHGDCYFGEKPKVYEEKYKYEMKCLLEKAAVAMGNVPMLSNSTSFQFLICDTAKRLQGLKAAREVGANSALFAALERKLLAYQEKVGEVSAKIDGDVNIDLGQLGLDTAIIDYLTRYQQSKQLDSVRHAIELDSNLEKFVGSGDFLENNDCRRHKFYFLACKGDVSKIKAMLILLSSQQLYVGVKWRNQDFAAVSNSSDLAKQIVQLYARNNQKTKISFNHNTYYHNCKHYNIVQVLMAFYFTKDNAELPEAILADHELAKFIADTYYDLSKYKQEENQRKVKIAIGLLQDDPNSKIPVSCLKYNHSFDLEKNMQPFAGFLKFLCDKKIYKQSFFEKFKVSDEFLEKFQGLEDDVDKKALIALYSVKSDLPDSDFSLDTADNEMRKRLSDNICNKNCILAVIGLYKIEKTRYTSKFFSNTYSCSRIEDFAAAYQASDYEKMLAILGLFEFCGYRSYKKVVSDDYFKYPLFILSDINPNLSSHHERGLYLYRTSITNADGTKTEQVQLRIVHCEYSNEIHCLTGTTGTTGSNELFSELPWSKEKDQDVDSQGLSKKLLALIAPSAKFRSTGFKVELARAITPSIFKFITALAITRSGVDLIPFIYKTDQGAVSFKDVISKCSLNPYSDSFSVSIEPLKLSAALFRSNLIDHYSRVKGSEVGRRGILCSNGNTGRVAALVAISYADSRSTVSYALHCINCINNEKENTKNFEEELRKTLSDESELRKRKVSSLMLLQIIGVNDNFNKYSEFFDVIFAFLCENQSGCLGKVRALAMLCDIGIEASEASEAANEIDKRPQLCSFLSCAFQNKKDQEGVKLYYALSKVGCYIDDDETLKKGQENSSFSKVVLNAYNNKNVELSKIAVFGELLRLSKFSDPDQWSTEKCNHFYNESGKVCDTAKLSNFVTFNELLEGDDEGIQEEQAMGFFNKLYTIWPRSFSEQLSKNAAEYYKKNNVSDLEAGHLENTLKAIVALTQYTEGYTYQEGNELTGKYLENLAKAYGENAAQQKTRLVYAIKVAELDDSVLDTKDLTFLNNIQVNYKQSEIVKALDAIRQCRMLAENEDFSATEKQKIINCCNELYNFRFAENDNWKAGFSNHIKKAMKQHVERGFLNKVGRAILDILLVLTVIGIFIPNLMCGHRFFSMEPVKEKEAINDKMAAYLQQ